LQLLQRWREEAQRSGQAIGPMVLAHEIGRDGFWLAQLRGTRGPRSPAVHSWVRYSTKFRLAEGRPTDPPLYDPLMAAQVARSFPSFAGQKCGRRPALIWPCRQEPAGQPPAWSDLSHRSRNRARLDLVLASPIRKAPHRCARSAAPRLATRKPNLRGHDGADLVGSRPRQGAAARPRCCCCSRYSLMLVGETLSKG
jgi:hypothetical protein